jgi:hypothetical protein
MKTRRSVFARRAIGVLFALVLGCLFACGGQKEEPSPEAEAAAEPLSKNELKAISAEYNLQAEEEIADEDLEKEVDKLEKEIAADK